MEQAARTLDSEYLDPASPLPQLNTSSALLDVGEALSRFQVRHKVVSLEPRGLINKSNFCYIHATLQALLSCTPFYHLMRSLSSKIQPRTERSTIPIIYALADFVSEFSPCADQLRSSRHRIRELASALTSAFEPLSVHAVLAHVSSNMFRAAGRQEDAEEFLTCLLNGLQDEMTKIQKLQHVKEIKTPISQIFSGQLRFLLHRQGAEPTGSVQSFFSLQLDIQKPGITSVEQALESLVAQDPVVSLTCPKTGNPVKAWQQVALELTPPALILHLKRFLYDPATGSVKKLLKLITFPVDLNLNKKLMSAECRQLKPGFKRYRLFAVVSHTGSESTRGHYMTDAYHSAYQHWMRYDDSKVTAIKEAAVLRPEPPLVPYILFYRRWQE